MWNHNSLLVKRIVRAYQSFMAAPNRINDGGASTTFLEPLPRVPGLPESFVAKFPELKAYQAQLSDYQKQMDAWKEKLVFKLQGN